MTEAAETTRRASPQRTPSLRSVAMPAEHGGWGLTLEPGVLGLLAVPSPAGLLLAIAALLAFLVRTPLRLVLIDRQRGGTSRPAMSVARLGLARRVALAELAGIAAAAQLAAWLAYEPLWWLPAVAAVPLLALALWYDMHSMSRRLRLATGLGAVAGPGCPHRHVDPPRACPSRAHPWTASREGAHHRG